MPIDMSSQDQEDPMPRDFNGAAGKDFSMVRILDGHISPTLMEEDVPASSVSHDPGNRRHAGS